MTMNEHAVPAYFVRGGTSKGLVMLGRDLPADRGQWGPVLLAAMGSPDPYGRQLNGMGGGLSSLSKVCVLFPATRTDIDLEYLFVQVQIRDSVVDYSGNCGNMSSAVGPIAIEMGLVSVPDGPVTVRMLNRNTSKVIANRFDVKDGRPLVVSETGLTGVQGPGVEVMLDFIDPAGAATGKLLPTGQATDTLNLSGNEYIEASLVDASNPSVFIEASSVGLVGNESAEQIESDPALLKKLEQIRQAASMRMGLSDSWQSAAENRMTPLLGIVSHPQRFVASDGTRFTERDMDVSVRFLSNGQPHRAVPATGALSTVAASRVFGSLVHKNVAVDTDGFLEEIQNVRVAHPSGCTEVEVESVASESGSVEISRLSVYRSMRKLMTGMVHVPIQSDMLSTEEGRRG